MGAGRARRAPRAPDGGLGRTGPAAAGSLCGLEDTSATLHCALPGGHAGAHADGRTGHPFEDTLAAHIGDAGAYYYDRQGRPVPIHDAF